MYRPQVIPLSGEEYYEYGLIYVDDIPCLSHAPEDTMRDIANLYRLKETPAEPSRYQGMTVYRTQVADGRKCWHCRQMNMSKILW